jgi:hypothetical protein
MVDFKISGGNMKAILICGITFAFSLAAIAGANRETAYNVNDGVSWAKTYGTYTGNISSECFFSRGEGADCSNFVSYCLIKASCDILRANNNGAAIAVFYGNQTTYPTCGRVTFTFAEGVHLWCNGAGYVSPNSGENLPATRATIVEVNDGYSYDKVPSTVKEGSVVIIGDRDDPDNEFYHSMYVTYVGTNLDHPSYKEIYIACHGWGCYSSEPLTTFWKSTHQGKIRFYNDIKTDNWYWDANAGTQNQHHCGYGKRLINPLSPQEKDEK